MKQIYIIAVNDCKEYFIWVQHLLHVELIASFNGSGHFTNASSGCSSSFILKYLLYSVAIATSRMLHLLAGLQWLLNIASFNCSGHFSINTTNEEHKVQVLLDSDFRFQNCTQNANIRFRTYSTVRMEVQPVWCLKHASRHMLIHVLFLAKYMDIMDTGVTSVGASDGTTQCAAGSVPCAFQSPGGMWFLAWLQFYTGEMHGRSSGTKSSLGRSVSLKLGNCLTWYYTLTGSMGLNPSPWTLPLIVLFNIEYSSWQLGTHPNSWTLGLDSLNVLLVYQFILYY
ncbi:hypothetical protein BDQ17DRAFT_1327255 [Cyathus striatus]|nr:hypothetical protein BDQ17DRAFT_1327255 [Cyathus striatus]